MLPRDQFQIFGLENFDGPLCTGGCKKLVYMAEILVTLSVLREPARIFLNKMCSFDVTDFEKTLLVTLYQNHKTSLLVRKGREGLWKAKEVW